MNFIGLQLIDGIPFISANACMISADSHDNERNAWHMFSSAFPDQYVKRVYWKEVTRNNWPMGGYAAELTTDSAEAMWAILKYG